MAADKVVRVVQHGLGGSNEIPSVGYGCWKVPRDVCAELVEGAIRAGYRHIDGAADYGNEKEVGAGIRAAIGAKIVTRQDLWVTGKLWNTYHAAEHVEMACRKTLADLGLDYLDLFLIHFPIALKFVPIETRYPPEWFHDPQEARMVMVQVPVETTWRAMEKLVGKGLVRNIGISNFNCQLVRDLWNYATIKPAVLQVELHPYLQQKKLVRYAQSLGIHVTAYSPLGHGASYWNDSVAAIRETVVKDLAKKHGRTEGQVILRWGIQRGCSVVPKSSNPDRIKQNCNIFDFHLDADDMKQMETLERGLRFNDPGVYCEQVFNTFCPIYE